MHHAGVGCGPDPNRRTAKDLDTPACETALGDDAVNLPKRAEPGVSALLIELELGANFAPVKGAFEQFLVELDRVPTADRALIDGRNVWRTSVEAISQTGLVPADLCEQLRRWRLAGYPANATPAAQPQAIHSWLLAEATAKSEPSRGRRETRRAAKRMIELGVTAGQARRFAGEALYDGIDNGLLTIESSEERV